MPLFFFFLQMLIGGPVLRAPLMWTPSSTSMTCSTWRSTSRTTGLRFSCWRAAPWPDSHFWTWPPYSPKTRPSWPVAKLPRCVIFWENNYCYGHVKNCKEFSTTIAVNDIPPMFDLWGEGGWGGIRNFKPSDSFFFALYFLHSHSCISQGVFFTITYWLNEHAYLMQNYFFGECLISSINRKPHFKY